MYKYLYLPLPIQPHFEVSQVPWPMELPLTHHLQNVSFRWRIKPIRQRIKPLRWRIKPVPPAD